MRVGGLVSKNILASANIWVRHATVYDNGREGVPKYRYVNR